MTDLNNQYYALFLEQLVLSMLIMYLEIKYIYNLHLRLSLYNFLLYLLLFIVYDA